MSKSDEIRRMREQQYAHREKDAVPPADPASSVPAGTEAGLGTPRTDVPRRSFQRRSPTAHTTPDEQGKCSACGKVRGLVNGLIVVHQKGLGKICPGSRKEPA